MSKTSLERLYERAPLGMRLGLDPMREACARTGNPERTFPIVHVAGTNGKGSVCAMVESIARAHGLRTGLYTSPHLCRFAERIRIDGEPVADLDRHLEAALDSGPDLSFFETATLAAMFAIRDARVDLGILEVGIGGRLDATNVIPTPRAAAITRIALDHTQLLGETVELIAREKAGIAKQGLDIVVGPSQESVRAAIEEVATANGATISLAEENEEARIFLDRAPHVGLDGAHQIDNARIAFILGRRIGASIEECGRGIASVLWPGRLETLDFEGTRVVLDAAHNPDGAAALARFAETLPRPRALVFGTLADKAWHEMIDVLAPVFDERVYCAPKGRAATDPTEIAARHAGTIADGPVDALSRAAASRPAVVVAAGSLYLIGAIRAALLGLERDPPIAL